METIMKRLLNLMLFYFCSIQAQEYKITFFGLPTVDVKMVFDNNSIQFNVQTVGLVNIMWPTDNQYSVTYDSSHYGLINYEKIIKQGATQYKVAAVYEGHDSTLHYEEKILTRIPEIQTIFSLLARIQKESVKALDTKWFPMDHDGELYSARFLWADTSTISIANSTILCDHYRLDIKAQDDVTSTPEQSDYFMNNIVSPEVVRQIWVERNGLRRIIQATVKIYGINIIAKIDHV